MPSEGNKMVVLPLVLILFLVSGVKCQVEFIARPPNSTVSVPDSPIFLKNIGNFGERVSCEDLFN